MWARALKAVLLSAGGSGVAALLVGVVPGTPGDAAAPVWLSPGRAAYAQGPAVGVLYRVVADRSEVRYRVREQLASLNFPNDAVGTTNVIEGGIALDRQGRVLTGDSRVTIDVRTLRSDEPRRDNYLRRRTLETDRYPAVVFVPTEVRGLRFPLPQAGSASFELVGDLTVRDVTRRITWEATAIFAGEDVSVRAQTAFRFGDFGLPVPRLAVVLSIEDLIRLETDLLLRPGS